MDAFITGIGWVTAAGTGWGSLGDRFQLVQGALPALSRKDVFDEPNQRFGRQSEYSKVGVAALAFALRDAGLEKWTEKRPVPVIAATVLGCLSTDLEYFRTVLPECGGLGSPNLFAYTLANCFLGEAALQFGLTGSHLAINEAQQGGLSALRFALEELACGGAETAVAGICDLATPAGGSDAPAVLPGAVFVVLSAQEPAGGCRYGTVSLAADGTVRTATAAVGSLVELVERALADR